MKSTFFMPNLREGESKIGQQLAVKEENNQQ